MDCGGSAGRWFNRRSIIGPNQKQAKLGEILVEGGFINDEQLEKAIAAQAVQKIEQAVYHPLGEVCVEMGFISRRTLKEILVKYRKKIRIGDLLVNIRAISEEQLNEALQEQIVSEKKLGQILVDKAFVSKAKLAETLSLQLGIPRVATSSKLIDKTLLKNMSPGFFQSKMAVPAGFDKESGILMVIMDDPLDAEAISVFEKSYKATVEPAFSTSGDVQALLDELFKGSGSAIRSASATVVPSENTKPSFSAKDMVVQESSSGQAPQESNVTDTLDFILSSAVKDGASDVHIEPFDNRLRVRFRVDGLLTHMTDLPKSLAAGLVTRIKAMSKMDITERRRHQDGRIDALIMGQEVDLRVSTYASVYGENTVIRILHRQSSLVELDQIGFSPLNLTRYRKILKYPGGIILTTGPTGTGKTTTLYASLLFLNEMHRKIITVEDPPEYMIDGAIQGKLDPNLHLSYDDFIKSMMRQDPDVIMIGEIRDTESAAAAIQAALTGHKVLSSFHTDDSTGALVRLMNMGIETFLISSTVVSIVAQRLVRALCPRCKERMVPHKGLLGAFHSIDSSNAANYAFYGPRGCPECHNTGYKGRSAVHELLEVNDDIRDAILARSTSNHIRLTARKTGTLISMAEDGFYKAVKGVTSLEEVLRVVFVNAGDGEVPYTIDRIMSMCDGAELEADESADTDEGEAGANSLNCRIIYQRSNSIGAG